MGGVKIKNNMTTYATMKYTKPSAKISVPIREWPADDVCNLIPVRHSTMKSKHIEYMNVADMIVGLVSVMTHPALGSHWAFSRTPAKAVYV